MTNTALTGAVDWVRAVLTGTIGTSPAVIAVATLGLLMLSGRLPLRRGVTAVVGCFILFSASAIASGLIGAVGGTAIPIEQSNSPQPSYTPTLPRAAPYDPYAGASVPARTSDAPMVR